MLLTVMVGTLIIGLGIATVVNTIMDVYESRHKETEKTESEQYDDYRYVV